jgi:hypothetical protein
MNDYEMTFLASERGRELHAEAARDRLAKSAGRRPTAAPKAGKPGRPRLPRIRLGALLGRASV